MQITNWILKSLFRCEKASICNSVKLTKAKKSLSRWSNKKSFVESKIKLFEEKNRFAIKFWIFFTDSLNWTWLFYDRFLLFQKGSQA